jgi:hypothetical protein
MAPASDVEAIVDGPDVPLVVVARRGPVAAVVLAFDPLQSDWPYQRGFVTFLANAVEWLGSLDQAAVQEAHFPGETLSVRASAGVKDVEVTLPDGTRQQVPVREGSATFGPVARAGTYAFRWSDDRGEQRRLFAVNPAADEGRIAAAPEVSLGTRSVTGSAGGGVTLSDLWPWALGVALVVLVLEWWVYHRRNWIRRDPSAQRVRPIGMPAR